MSASTELAPPTVDTDAPPRMVHLEHPHRPGEAWCLARGVLGEHLPQSTPIDCVVCDDLAFRAYLER